MRKPDVPCVRCGRLTFSSARSAPPDRRLCRNCRGKPAESGETPPSAGETAAPEVVTSAARLSRAEDWMRDSPDWIELVAW